MNKKTAQGQVITQAKQDRGFLRTTFDSVMTNQLTKVVNYTGSIVGNMIMEKMARTISTSSMMNPALSYNILTELSRLFPNTCKFGDCANIGDIKATVKMLKIDSKTYAILNIGDIEKEHGVYKSIHLSVYGDNKIQFFDKFMEKVKPSNKKYIQQIPGWKRVDIPSRTFNNVFMDKSKKKEIIDFIDNWKKLNSFYAENGIIYKTGILLYGEPGTGKSSLIQAIANYLHMNVYMVDVQDPKIKDSLMNESFNNSIVVFEDIDTVASTRKDKKKDNNLGMLLNTLDGIMSPRDCIFIATTNKLGDLDEALVRSGRFDLKVEMGLVDKSIANEMCKALGCNPKTILKDLQEPYRPSDIQAEIFKTKHIIKTKK